MENASKGLLIAGGMLLALIVLSLLVYMLSATGRFNDAISERKATEELAAYNAKFEAYHKPFPCQPQKALGQRTDSLNQRLLKTCSRFYLKFY